MMEIEELDLEDIFYGIAEITGSHDFGGGEWELSEEAMTELVESWKQAYQATDTSVSLFFRIAAIEDLEKKAKSAVRILAKAERNDLQLIGSLISFVKDEIMFRNHNIFYLVEHAISDNGGIAQFGAPND